MPSAERKRYGPAPTARRCTESTSFPIKLRPAAATKAQRFFFVGSREASQTAVWHAGSSSTLNLTVGPPFALISGSTSLTCDQVIEHHIVPFINGTACGEQMFGGLPPPCNGQLVSYADVVLSAQQRPGCGVEGAPITFKLLDPKDNVVSVANETGTWHAWDGDQSSYQELALTFTPSTPVRVGNVGDGPDSGASPWLWPSLATASIGVAACAVGLALRRRATKQCNSTRRRSMNRRFGLLLVPALGLALAMSSTAHAATPTPTVTSTPTATSTPSPQQVARFGGEEWADGDLSTDSITARIGDVVCGNGGPLPIADAPSVYHIDVVSEQVTPGCGHEGATINFFVGDRQAPQTAVWHGGSSSTLNLIVGPPFARISGSTSLSATRWSNTTSFPSSTVSRAATRTSVAHLARRNGQGLGYQNPVWYQDIVLSAQQQTGCGVESAPITFKLLDLKGNVVSTANETGTWHAWDGGVSDDSSSTLLFHRPQPSTLATSATARQAARAPGFRCQSGWLRLALRAASAASRSAGAAAFRAAFRRVPRPPYNRAPTLLS